jgi:ubiquinone/menaquinone biosynthesis C-methylase UbiE
MKKTYNRPSDFVKYVVKKGYIKKNDIVIDFACGNGRDTKYLETKCNVVFGIDKSQKATEKAFKLCNKSSFVNMSVEEFSYKGYNVAYMRWFLHTIEKDVANRILKKTYRQLKNGGYLLIEARYGRNNIFNWNPFHYRRLINEETCFELKKIGFKIIECNVDKNFSKLGKNNPKLIRIICKKVKND